MKKEKKINSKQRKVIMTLVDSIPLRFIVIATEAFREAGRDTRYIPHYDELTFEEAAIIIRFINVYRRQHGLR